MYRWPAANPHGADALSADCQTTAHCSVPGIRKARTTGQPPAGKPRTVDIAPPSRAKSPMPPNAVLDVTSIRIPVFVGAGPTNAGGGTEDGEKVATNVLAPTGPGGLLTGPDGLLLTGADTLGLTVATSGEDTAAVAGAPNGLPAECGSLPATASQVTPPASTSTTAPAITSDRGGRGHRAGS